jgi:Universal stress protein family
MLLGHERVSAAQVLKQADALMRIRVEPTEVRASAGGARQGGGRGVLSTSRGSPRGDRERRQRVRCRRARPRLARRVAGPRPAGATALEVITRAAKPVVLVPPEARPHERFTRLLVPIEGTGLAPPALRDIIVAADRRELGIIVLHLHSPATVPAFSDHEPHGTRAWDQEFLARHVAAPHDRVSVVRYVGTPVDDVSSVAERIGAKLIVLVWSRSLAKGRARVVTSTLTSTRIPVLLLPAATTVDRAAQSVHRRTANRSRVRMPSRTINA